MNADEFLPDAETIAAIEKDIATYNERRRHEHAALERREPIVMMAYVAGLAFLAYLGYRLLSHSDIWYMPVVLIAAMGLGGWSHVQKWAQRDAAWTQQNFRDHIVPVMLGFVPNLRYGHGAAPRCFDRIPKALLPPHNKKTFDDAITATLDGRRIELFEAKLAQQSKNSETVMFQGAILCCRLTPPFPGLLVATRRTGDFRRFLRDLFGTGGLEEITVSERGLSELYEFRTDNRAQARQLLKSGLAELLVSISKLWRNETPQIAVSRGDVFVLLPSTQNFFELPSIDRAVSYRSHIEPMTRQFASFLAIAREVGRLDAEPQPQPQEAVAEPAQPADDAPQPAAEPFIPLLDPLLGGDEPPPEDTKP